ncbi:MAG: hypothetical protein ACK401_07075 [Archaeoglobaceae archaeon]
MRFILLVLLLLGVIDSAYLLYTNYVLYTLPYCPIDVCLLPADFIVPSYAFAILGLLWFLAGIVLIFVRKNTLLRAWQVLGVTGAVGLFSYSLAIQYYCTYCYLAHALAIVSVLLSWKWLK